MARILAPQALFSEDVKKSNGWSHYNDIYKSASSGNFSLSVPIDRKEFLSSITFQKDQAFKSPRVEELQKFNIYDEGNLFVDSAVDNNAELS